MNEIILQQIKANLCVKTVAATQPQGGNGKGGGSRESEDNGKHNLHTNRQTETELKQNEMKRIETKRSAAQQIEPNPPVEPMRFFLFC